MSDQRRRLGYYLGVVLVIILVYTLLYRWGMTVLEGRPRTFIDSLAVVVETFTTVGYGEDAPWQSPLMEILVMLMELTGVGLLFLTLPLFIGPWAEERFRASAPTRIDGLTDHVVLCEFTSRGETTIEELAAWDRDYAVIEPDNDRALELHRQGLTVIHGDPESTETLEGANVGQASHVVVDAPDNRSASIVLSARELTDEARILGIVEDPRIGTYLTYAGCDEVFTPRRLLGESIASRVTAGVSTELGDTVPIDADFQLAELPIQGGCAVAGLRLAESGIRERTGANILGIWQKGEFIPVPDPDHELTEDDILLVAGSEEQLSSLKRLTLSEVRPHPRGTVIVAGLGRVGTTVAGQIAKSRMDYVTVDRETGSDVDVVGDATDEDVLVEAGVESADALVVALADDTAAMYAVLAARELNPDIQILVRVDEDESVPKLYRAGADYVLALATVSGRILASAILEQEEVMAPQSQVEIVRTTAPGLSGQSLAGADIRSRTGATVIGVERNGSVLTDLDPGFVLEKGDRVVLAGTDEGISRFNELAQ